MQHLARLAIIWEHVLHSIQIQYNFYGIFYFIFYFFNMDDSQVPSIEFALSVSAWLGSAWRDLVGEIEVLMSFYITIIVIAIYA